MNQREFLDNLRHFTPNSEAYEIEARAYKNARQIDELIHLPKSYWDYVEWAEKNTNINFATWVIHCDQNETTGYTLSHQLMYWLWLDECNRFRAGDPTPNSYPPMGYEGWADEYHSQAK